jgi:hypothetical protein
MMTFFGRFVLFAHSRPYRHVIMLYLDHRNAKLLGFE